MIELFNASVSLVNLPFTVLLLIVILYWLSVIIGVADIDLFDTDWEFDAEVESPGFAQSLLNFLNIGELPLMVILSVMILIAWCFSVLANHYVNPGRSGWIALGLLVPNLGLSWLLSGVITRPVGRLFSPKKTNEMKDALYKIGVAATSEVTPTFGQVEIETDGAPVLVNARTAEGTVLVKGEKALIYDADREKGVYFVEKFNE